MSLRELLPLGQPPRDDVDAAARLWLEYRRRGISTDAAAVFWRSVSDPDAVMRRAAELGSASTMQARWKHDQDTDWLGSADIRPPPTCPACSSNRVIPIIRGEPTPEAEAAAYRGEAVIGGCMVMEGLPLWSCRACGGQFGSWGEKTKENDDG